MENESPENLVKGLEEVDEMLTTDFFAGKAYFGVLMWMVLQTLF